MAHHLTLTVYHIHINIERLLQFQFCSTIFPVWFHFSVCEDSDVPPGEVRRHQIDLLDSNDDLIFRHPVMGIMGA